MKILIIRNLNLKLQQFATDYIVHAVELVNLEHPELIVIAGNISRHDKRSLLFAEEIAAATKTKTLYNIGLLEYTGLGEMQYVKDAILIRLRTNQAKTNVMWVEDYISDEVEFKSIIGWPLIQDTEENYRKTIPGHWLIRVRAPRYGDDLLDNIYPYVYTVEEFNKEHLKEEMPAWSGNKRKILLTSIDQQTDNVLDVKYISTKIFTDNTTIISPMGDQFSIVTI